MVRKILVGIDGSAGAYRALEVASDLAVRLEASVTVMYVATDQETGRYGAKPTYVTSDEILAGDRLSRAKAMLDGKKARYETVVEMGDPAQKILERGKEGYDMIVVGTRGLSGVRELILGSVSSRVVQSSPVPVLVVP